MHDSFRRHLESITAFSTEALEAVQDRVKTKHVRRGECLEAEGQVADKIYFVNSGLLHLQFTVKEKAQTAKLFRENEFCSSYESFLTRVPSAYSIDALEDCELIVLGYDDLQFLYKNYPVYERLGRMVAEDLFIFLCDKNRKIRLTPEEHYVDFVRRYPDLVQRVPQYIIASYLNMTPETLSRIRKRMVKMPLDLGQEKFTAVAS
jgi:CRP/FNR family transcriptional regulator, anaerobic regulatory protein